MKNSGILISIIIVVLLLIVLGGVVMMGLSGFGMMGGYGGYGGMMGGYGGFGFNLLGMIVPLVFWALILVGIMLLVVWVVLNVSKTSQPSNSDPAIEILKARYVRGEITKEQFNAIKRDLR